MKPNLQSRGLGISTPQSGSLDEGVAACRPRERGLCLSGGQVVVSAFFTEHTSSGVSSTPLHSSESRSKPLIFICPLHTLILYQLKTLEKNIRASLNGSLKSQEEIGPFLLLQR